MSASEQNRWTEPHANAWWKDRDWVCGFNYLPSSAVNFLEMWMDATFDRATISRELGWAAELGFNAVRVNPHFLVWQHDRDGLIERMDWFLAAASGLGIDTVFVPFDDCEFGGEPAQYGRQPEPLPGVHNSRAVASPGRARVMDPANWPAFEAYTRDLVRSFRDDPRVLFWDLYNEPGNRMIFTEKGFAEYDAALADHSLALMRDCFGWARAEDPVQPLTVGAWRTAPVGSDAPSFDNEIDQTALELSDIVTFHGYCSRDQAKRLIDQLAPLGRPILTTEWMARAVDSRIADQLELYHSRKVGCFNWGLVKGRTQTHLPWPAALVEQHGRTSSDKLWFHDIFWPDGTPYDSLRGKPDQEVCLAPNQHFNSVVASCPVSP
jgi:hypothetical protein